MRDSQQKRAKSEAFDKLSKSMGSWFQDFCQKIIPVKLKRVKKNTLTKGGC